MTNFLKFAARAFDIKMYRKAQGVIFSLHAKIDVQTPCRLKSGMLVRSCEMRAKATRRFSMIENRVTTAMCKVASSSVFFAAFRAPRLFLKTRTKTADKYSGDALDMNSFETNTLKAGQLFTDQLLLDPQFVLLDPSTPFSNDLKSALDEWGFKVVHSKGTIVGSGPKVAVDLSKFESVDDFLEDTPKEKPAGSELNHHFRQAMADATKRIKANPSASPMDDVEKVYDEAMKYIDATYTRFATHKTLNIKDLSDAVRDFCNFLRDYKKFILRITPKVNENDKNFIVSHSLRSTMFALTIGIQLNMPMSNLIELGVASIVHEIGQIRLPPQLYLTDRALSPQEKAKLMTHTILSYNILKENGFPLAVQVGVLEHHERENGKGYPRRIDGKKTSLYGKILAVACSFEAISAPRRHKAAKSTYEAMLEMLSNKDKQYNDTVIKALVQAISLFPIGAYVYLSNGKIAQVTEANSSDPRTPIVQILGERNELGNPRTVQTDMQNFKILRVLSKDELEAVLKMQRAAGQL